jgi:zinc-binding alcohol dehydrogenase/oxidoreductase
MKAIELRASGGPEVLIISDVSTPKPGRKEVLVALRYAALNRRDILVRSRPSYEASMPFIPGSDGAGHIAALGSEVTGFSEGDKVVVYPALNWGASEGHPGGSFEILGGPTNGTYAQYVCLPAENVFPIPDELSFEEAAALPIAGLTSWRALISKARLLPGERVFIPGIGGGAAIFSLQIALMAGGRVFVSSHSNEKIGKALDLGAEAGVDYLEPGWAETIRSRSGGGVDVVIDSVGSATFKTSVDLLRPGGRMVIFGTTSGAEVDLDLRPIYHKQISIQGTTMGSPAEFQRLLTAVANPGLHPVIDSCFPLVDAAKAHRRLEAKEHFGKILLEVE